MTYSFRFYGRSPSDWKGAEHPEFSVQLARVPSDDEKRELARLFLRSTRGTVVDRDEVAWRWSERFANVGFGVKWTRGRAHLGTFTDFLMMARRIVPIVEVIYLNALDGTGRWDRWSVAQQASPDPGPPGKVGVGFPRAVDDRLPALARDPAFEDGWARALAEEAEARLRSALAAMKPGELGLEPVDVDRASARQPPIEWADEVLAAFEIPDPPTVFVKYGDGGYHRHQPGDHLVERGAHPEVPIAFVYDARDQPTDVVILDASGRRQVLSWDPAHASRNKNRIRTITTSHDGSAVFVATERALHRVDRAGGKLEATWAPTHEHGPLYSIDWLDEGRILAVTEKQLLVLDLGTSPPSVIAQRPNSGKRGSCLTTERMVPQGTLIVTHGWKTSSIVTFFVGDALKKAGELPAEVTPVQGPLGQIWFESSDAIYALTGVDELVAKLAPKPSKPAKKAKRAAAAAPTLVALDRAPEPDDPITAAERAAFPAHARLYKAAGHPARILGLAPRAAAPHGWSATSFPRLFVGTPAAGLLEVGELTELFSDVKLYHADAGAIAASGRFAVVLNGYHAWRIDLDSREREDVWTQHVADRDSPRYAAVDKGQDIAWVDDARVLVLGEKGLALMARGDEGWAVAHTVKITKPKRMKYLAQHDCCVVQTLGTTRLVAFAVVGGKLKKVFEDKTVPATGLLAVDGEVIATAHPSLAWRIDGLAAATAELCRAS